MTLPNWAIRAVAEYRVARSLALLFDYDGTLTPIVAHPSNATLPSATREALEAAAALNGVEVGIVSGRALAELKNLIGLPGLWYAGSGGMHLDLGGEELVDAALAGFDNIADTLIGAIAELIRRFPGSWVEQKPGCLTAHYRALTPLKAACFVAEVRDTLAGLGSSCPPLRVMEVDRGLEVALAGSWTKGEAVDRILDAWGCDPFVVYAGNAANDEVAMVRVNARGGTTIRIGHEAPAVAQAWVATPQEFTADLVGLTAELALTVRHRSRTSLHSVYSA
ncbi:MAG TPA: trehalose-phosphatase [Gemmata sp.]|jgi:trehalose-phosphatase|nr:trehalose-phosphatase [Gemmata sp.]